MVSPSMRLCGFVTGGQHDDRHARRGAQIAGEIEAGLARHHDVEDQQVEAQALELGARVGGGLRRGDAVALGHQEARKQIADDAVVVDHQQVGRVVGESGGHRGHGLHRLSLILAAAAPGRRAR